MLDIKFIRENPDIVKENIKKKFQDEKLPLVDEVIELDSQRRANIQEADQLRSDRNRLSKQVGMLMGQAKKDPTWPMAMPSHTAMAGNITGVPPAARIPAFTASAILSSPMWPGTISL